ncbi:hypothetical protein THAOC_31562 [Thalassiosira oceanica]|uniref:Uncharacterized protein n=1 Tax=Thalassiosira oceanica TaxID=159749 RepID=K0RB61_THAOC|nr:hypothetical protein THAOC_31562 [Thalassiosira oceanica]|eukprot:EJK49549.1 hypothetical protein THAOC_31562 [Thalassiosira oceanica]
MQPHPEERINHAQNGQLNADIDSIDTKFSSENHRPDSQDSKFEPGTLSRRPRYEDFGLWLSYECAKYALGKRLVAVAVGRDGLVVVHVDGLAAEDVDDLVGGCGQLGGGSGRGQLGDSGRCVDDSSSSCSGQGGLSRCGRLVSEDVDGLVDSPGHGRWTAFHCHRANFSRGGTEGNAAYSPVV